MSHREPTHTNAFSLIELLIAITVLGLGLVMVATLFPVALGRARDMSESTRKIAIFDGTATTLGLLARVDGLAFNATSFAGDLLYDASQDPPNPRLVARSDTRVHLLNMENVAVAPRAFVPNRLKPWNDPLVSWQLDRPDFFDVGPSDFDAICPTDDFCLSSFLSARIAFESRVYPPMRARRKVDSEGVFNTDLADGDDAWDDLLDTRRQAFAVLHRFHRVTGPRPYAPPVNVNVPDDVDQREQAQAAVDDSRDLDVYLVALRRPNPVLRYARQDPATAPDPTALSPAPVVVPAARPEADDVLLPEPWRVQIQIVDNATSGPTDLGSQTMGSTSGIPTEVKVPPDGIADAGASAAAAVMLTQMFQRGTQFIDEINGLVYTVIKTRTNAAGTQSTLTLDREVTLEDIDLAAPLGPTDPLCPTCITVPQQIDAGMPPVPDPEELLRTVWVFPPPVLESRVTDGIVAFDGRQPVIGLDVRPLSLSPRE